MYKYWSCKFLFCVSLWGLCFFTTGAFNKLYTVTYHVDMASHTANIAKKKGFSAESQKAWDILLNRLLLTKDQAIVKSYIGNQFKKYLESINIRHEKSGATRYVADLNFHFNQEKLKKLFQKLNIIPSERLGPKLLVLPLYRSENRFSLWEENNHWLTVWQNKEAGKTLLQFIAPLGDLEDQTLLPLEKALVSNKEALQSIVNRYEADDIAFVLVEEEIVTPEADQDATKQKTYKVMIYPNALQDNTQMYAETLHVDTPTEDIVENLTHIQKKLVHYFIESWKQKNIAQSEQKNTIKETYYLPSLAQQLSLVERLKNIEQIDKISIVNQGRQKITLEIFFQGSYNQLKQTIDQYLSEM